MEPVTSETIGVTVNGASYEREIDVRRLLVHFIRDELDLAPDPHRLRHRQLRRVPWSIDGLAVKSCMLLAVQADGTSIETVESLSSGRRAASAPTLLLGPPRSNCGYCTRGC